MTVGPDVIEDDRGDDRCCCGDCYDQDEREDESECPAYEAGFAASAVLVASYGAVVDGVAVLCCCVTDFLCECCIHGIWISFLYSLSG